MTCKDCIHYGICIFNLTNEEYKKCFQFKHKSRYIELPCAVGDTVYFAGIFTGQIIENTIVGNTVCKDDLIIHCSGEVWVSASQHLGKTAFLTKEEAEKALAERNAGNG